MAYQEDLTPSGDAGDELRFCGLPVLNVGWLEPPHPIPTGEMPPGFAQRLYSYCAWDKLVGLTMGHQDCGFCGATYQQLWERHRIPFGNGEIRVLGDGVAFAAPSLIHHYVAAHGYLPPPAFVAAVMHGPPPDAAALRAYRLGCWESVYYQGVRHNRDRDSPQPMPEAKPNAIVGPLIWRFRGIAIAAILIFAFLVVHPGGLVLSGPIVAVLLAAAVRFRLQLICPHCLRRLKLLWREPTDWSLPPNGPFTTMYCDECGIGLRPAPDLWGKPAAEVATWWR
jgi:hypothetical protein